MTPADSAIARRLRVQCERFGWLPGMAISGPTWGTSNGRITDVFDGHVCCGDWDLEPEDVPVPHDPATIGCFAAMARSATSDALLYVRSEAWSDGSHTFGAYTPTDRGGFEVEDRDVAVNHATEIEAWLAVLEATPSV